MKRKISLALALMVVAQLAACGGDAGNTGDTTTTPETEPPVVEVNFSDDLGDIKFEGQTFTMHLSGGDSGYAMEEETGEVFDDAVYKRNRLVEERLGITLEYVNADQGSDGGSQSKETTQIRQLIEAGDTENDVFLHVQHTGMPGMISDGYFVDWNTVPNLDLDKDYWYQNAKRDVSYGTKIFGMTGDYNLGSLSSTNCLYFNKRLMTDLGQDYPYQDVLDYKWTNDKFLALIKLATRELNGDDQITFDKDQVGYHGWSYEQLPAYFMGLGGDICIKDSNNMPVLNIDTERNNNIVEAIKATFAEPGAAWESTTYGIFNTEFIEGRLLFVHGHLSLAGTFSDMEDDFGLIPYPMLDEAQGAYHSRTQNTSGFTYIPKTNTDLAFTGACLEVLASASHHTTVPAYFDVVLTVKETRDTESEPMIEIIKSTASFYDEAIGFGIGGVIQSSQNLQSYYAGVKGTVEANLEKLIATYSDTAE